MDSTTAAAEDARKAKRTASGAGAVDLISILDEDVLLRILELVGDTRDASRTCVLSRRWLGLWKRVPNLRFASCWPAVCTAASSAAERQDEMKRQYVSCVNDILAEHCDTSDPDCYYYPFSSFRDVVDQSAHSPVVSMAADTARERCAALQRSALQQFVSCVNDILARRAQSDCAIESLVISYTTGSDSYGYKPRKEVAAAFVDAAQGWIQYAFRRQGLKSLIMDLHGLKCYLVMGLAVPPNLEEEEEQDGETCPCPVPVVLPYRPPIGMETMHLALGGASVRLPAANAMKFASLVDLSLEKMMITNGGARLLAYLVSPANCPRLKKLRMNQLRLHDGFNGEEMKLESSVLSELWIDHVNLSTSLELTAPGLRIFHIDHCPMEKLTVSAPRLEEVAFFPLGYPPRFLEFDGELPCVCVRSLKICLRAYRSSYTYCTSAPILAAANHVNVHLLGQCISVTSLHVTLKGQQTSKTNVDMITSMVPQLPQITSLTVNVCGDVFHQANFGTSVASILTRFNNLRNLSLHLPRHLYSMQVTDMTYPDHWISMAHLKRIELTGLSATELWFAKAMLASAKRLRMITISFTADCWKQKHKMAAYKQMLHDEGMTTSHGGEFTLTCHKQSTHASTCKI